MSISITIEDFEHKIELLKRAYYKVSLDASVIFKRDTEDKLTRVIDWMASLCDELEAKGIIVHETSKDATLGDVTEELVTADNAERANDINGA